MIIAVKTDRGKRTIPLYHIAFITFLLFFGVGNILFALHLQRGIVPDEYARICIVEAFDETLGIPEETEKILLKGNVIEGNPFLYYWVLARIRNLVRLLFPSITSEALFLISRVFNSLLSVGTLIVTYILSRDVIKNPWLAILPPFVFANLQTFFMISAGISYDNLNNLLCVIAIFFFIKLVREKEKNFWRKTFVLGIVLGLAGLTKKTSLPLIIIVFLLWLYELMKNKPKWDKLSTFTGFLLVFSVIILAANVYMYGRNLVLYRTLIPGCHAIETAELCDQSNYYLRWKDIGQLEKLRLSDLRSLGYPGPLEYYFTHWMTIMLTRNIGAFGHKVWNNPLGEAYGLALIVIAMAGFSQLKKPTKVTWNLILISFFYIVFLYFYNYNEQLYYAFAGIAIQGRYIYPVIPALLILITLILESIKPKFMYYFMIIFVIVITLLGGPFQFLYYYNDYFYSWL